MDWVGLARPRTQRVTDTQWSEWRMPVSRATAHSLASAAARKNRRSECMSTSGSQRTYRNTHIIARLSRPPLNARTPERVAMALANHASWFLGSAFRQGLCPQGLTITSLIVHPETGDLLLIEDQAALHNLRLECMPSLAAPDPSSEYFRRVEDPDGPFVGELISQPRAAWMLAAGVRNQQWSQRGWRRFRLELLPSTAILEFLGSDTFRFRARNRVLNEVEQGYYRNLPWDLSYEGLLEFASQTSSTVIDRLGGRSAFKAVVNERIKQMVRGGLLVDRLGKRAGRG